MGLNIKTEDGYKQIAGNGKPGAESVLYYNTKEVFPVTGKSEKLYVDKSTGEIFSWNISLEKYIASGITSADQISYNNEKSEVEATNVQDAIDSIFEDITEGLVHTDRKIANISLENDIEAIDLSEKIIPTFETREEFEAYEAEHGVFPAGTKFIIISDHGDGGASDDQIQTLDAKIDAVSSSTQEQITDLKEYLTELDSQLSEDVHTINEAIFDKTKLVSIDLTIEYGKFYQEGTGDKGLYPDSENALVKVHGGETVFYSGNTSGRSAIVFFDEFHNYISGADIKYYSPTNVVDREIIVPQNARYMGLSSTVYSQYPLLLKRYGYINVDEMDASIRNIENRLKYIKGYEDCDYTVVDGQFLFKGTGNPASYPTAQYVYMPVSAYEKYYISGSIVANACVAFYAGIPSNTTYLSDINSLDNVENYEITIPVGVSYVGVSTVNKTDYPAIIRKLVTEDVTAEELIDKIKDTESTIKTNSDRINANDLEYSDRIFALENRVGFSFKDLDKGKIIFMSDDAPGVISDLYSIFHAHNMPMSEAVPVTALTRTANDGRKIPLVLNDIVSDGGEIFSHSIDDRVCNVATLGSLTEVENALRMSKEILTEYGYDIHGWISPNQHYEPLAVALYPKYYRYGCTGIYNNRSPLNFTRTLLYDIGLSGAKAKVDEIEANKGVVIFFSHFRTGEIEQFSLSDLDELLSYCESKNVDVTTYRDVFYQYGSIG